MYIRPRSRCFVSNLYVLVAGPNKYGNQISLEEVENKKECLRVGRASCLIGAQVMSKTVMGSLTNIGDSGSAENWTPSTVSSCKTKMSVGLEHKNRD